MKRITLAAGLAACFAVTSARADNTVIRRDPKGGKDVSVAGTIEAETAAGIKIKVGKDSQLIPPADILFVTYPLKDVSDIEFQTPYGKELKAQELTGDDRKKEFADALKAYQDLAKKAKATPAADRLLQYRIAMLAVEQAKDDPTKTAAAIQALNNFRTANGTGWEIVPATTTAARLLEASGDQAGARQAYEELAANPDVPKDIQLATNLQVAKMLVRDKKYADAETKLRSVLAGTTDEKQRAYVQVYLTQAEVAQGHAKDVAPLRAALMSAGDDDALKALAYNSLGDFYQQTKQPDEAFWDYLRVDVLYNQDREEHARALYNLWKLFDATRGDPQRAKECLARLKDDKSLAGTEYQARAMKESEGDKKAP